MSLSECTDQLVLALLPPSRITSVTWLSRQPEDSVMSDKAQAVAVNHGSAEEVLRQHPDLVVAGSTTTPATRALLHRLGFPLIELGSADSWQDIRATTRRLADAFGVRALGEALIAHMDAQLASLARAAGPKLRVAAWDGAGFSARPGSLYDALLQAAGAINVGNLPPASGTAAPDTEMLLAAAPEVLVEDVPNARQSDLRSNVLRHPLVRRFWQFRTVTVPAAYTVCGTPYSADGAVHLRHDLLAVQPLPFAPLAEP